MMKFNFVWRIGMFAFVLLFSEVHKAQNIQFRSNLKYPGHSLANIWGYVDSLGNEYALVGASHGLSIVNVTDPDNVSEVALIPGVNSKWREVKTWGHYAYVTTEGGGGLQIVDLKNLPDTNLPYKAFTDMGLNTIHALHIDNGYAYLYGSNLYYGSPVFLNLTDPWNPFIEGSYVNPISGYVHDGYVRNNIMYGSHIYAGFFSVVDVSNKSAPVLLQTQNTPHNFTHNTWLSDNSQVLYTTDEVDGSYLAAYDLSDLNDIVELDKLKLGSSVVHNTHVLNDYVVNSWYNSGVVIVDGHRPENLIVVGSYDTNPITGGGYHGAWGAYPFLPSGTILVSDMEEGLFVLTPDYKRACYLEGVVTDSLCGNTIDNVTISINSIGVSELNKVDGSYKTGYHLPGTYSVTFSKPGYQNLTVNNVSFASGQITLLDVKLKTNSGTLVSPDYASICSGESKKLTASGGISYSWSPSAGLSSTTNATTYASPTVTTIYTVSIQMQPGCYMEDTVSVYVGASPNIYTFNSKDTVCSGDTIMLTAGGADSYSWSPSLGLNTTSGDTVYATLVSDRTYTVSGSFTGSNCVTKETISLFVRKSPNVSVVPNNISLCKGDSALIVLSGAVTSMQWPSDSTINDVSVDGYKDSVYVSPQTPVNYTIVTTDIYSCVYNNVKVTVSYVKDEPNVVFTSYTDSVCVGKNAVINVSGADAFSWYTQKWTSPKSGKARTYRADSTLTIWVIGQNTPCPNDTDSVIVYTKPLPVVSVSGPPSVCPQDSFNLSAIGASTYMWSGWQHKKNAAGDTARGVILTSTSITATGTASNGCSASASINVMAKSVPDPTVNSLTGTFQMCEDSSLQLYAVDSALSYSWAPFTDLDVDTGRYVTANPKSTTTYTLSLTGVNGCKNSKPFQITVKPKPDVQVAKHLYDLCAGSGLNLSVTGNADAYNWLPGDGLNKVTGKSVTASPIVDVTYTITGTTTVCSTVDSDTIHVHVIPLPDLNVSHNPKNLCKGDTSFIVINTQVDSLYLPPGVNHLYDSLYYASPNVTTTYNIKAFKQACSITSSPIVWVNPSPSSPFINVIDDSIFSVNNIYTQYEWYFIGAMSDSMVASGSGLDSFQPVINGSYYVVVYNSYGCKSTSLNTVLINNVTVREITGQDVPGLIFYPNPTYDRSIVLRNLNQIQIKECELTDMLGRRLFIFGSIDGFETRLALPELSVGTYLLKVNTVTEGTSIYKLELR